MSNMHRLNALLDSGKLLHPVSDAFSIVDLAGALHSVMGVPNVSLSENAGAVKELIGEPEHLVLVLVDGFGMNFVEGLDGDAFIRAHLAAEMHTVFPSTTPIVLTTLATGEWPAGHAVIGWFLKLRQIDAVSTIISHIRTADKRPLSELGVGVQDAYPVPSRIGRARRETTHIMPEHIINSAYSNYWTGGVPQSGYDDDSPQRAIEMAFDMAIGRIRTARAPTCVYLYIPHVDNAAHRLGASHEDALDTAKEVDHLLGALADALPADARMVMTADHGQLDAPEGRRYVLDASDEIVRLCGGALTGDFRAVYADVRDENMGAFREAVNRRVGDDFLVLTASEVEEVGLLGRGTLVEETRYRMGRVLLLSAGDAIFDYREVIGDERHPIISHHGGLTPAEMRIPLVVA